MVNGKKIGILMRSKGISNKDMASRVGVSEAMMSFIVNGLKQTNVETLYRISKELGCTLDDLIVKEG